ncbi:MAG: hypothetical protein WBA12_01195 [Catalinimonas sp.]
MAKRALRLTMPVLGHVLGLGFEHLLAVQFVGGLLLLGIAALLAERVFNDRTTAVPAVLALSWSHPGNTCFTDPLGYFDGIAYLFLLLAMWSRMPVLITLCVLAAAFTDERGAVATGFVFLWWTYHAVEATNPKERRAAYGRAAAVGVGALLYGGLRLWLQQHYGLNTPVGAETNVGWKTWSAIYPWIPLGLFSGLEFWWLVLLGAVVILFQSRRYLFLGAFAGLIIVQTGIAASVFDLTRSTAYLTPSVFVALAVLRKELAREESRMLLLGTCLSCLLFPNLSLIGDITSWHAPLPLQALRWVMPLVISSN